MDFNKIKTIFFVTHITPLSSGGTSTDILTDTLLRGLHEKNYRVVLFAICPSSEFEEDVKRAYSLFSIKIVFLKCNYIINLSPLKQLLLSLRSTVSIHKYMVEIQSAIKELDFIPDLILANAPCIESVFYSKALSLLYRNAIFYEFWSDPFTLAGIIPDKIAAKRKILKWIELNVIKCCDKVIYGTKTLCYFQSRLFPSLSWKMSYVNLGFTEKKRCEKETPINGKFIYAGNYYNSYRNINPLIEAFKSLSTDCFLDVFGKGDCSVVPSKNVKFHSRVPAEEISLIESSYECIICILNHSCIQIPGKIFYNIDRKTKILIITMILI